MLSNVCTTYYLLSNVDGVFVFLLIMRVVLYTVLVLHLTIVQGGGFCIPILLGSLGCVLLY